MKMMDEILDPTERLLAHALTEARIDYEHRVVDGGFYLPAFRIFIDLGSSGADPDAREAKRADCMIAVQGRAAVLFLVAALLPLAAGAETAARRLPMPELAEYGASPESQADPAGEAPAIDSL